MRPDDITGRQPLRYLPGQLERQAACYIDFSELLQLKCLRRRTARERSPRSNSAAGCPGIAQA